MGSKAPSTTRYVRTPTAANIYVAKIPDKDFVAASDLTKEYEDRRKAIRKNFEAMGFSAADVKKRQELYRKQEEEIYKASMPKKPIV